MSMRRNLMNVMRNYTDAEVKVREATSNDAWGPSSSLMSEIADMTYNVTAFSEIMSMIWKRINDHGKNWRHVYKALTLLDYLIKTGSERVALQCKENIFAVQTLKDFQFFDRDGKDQGLNVREKSKQLVTLLKDDERLKTERARAMKAKERFAQATTGIGSNHEVAFGHGSSTPKIRHTPDMQRATHTEESSALKSEIEQARPQTAGEEEMQLQLALAMSKEEADQEKKVGDSDDIRLKMALDRSNQEVKTSPPKSHGGLLDLTAAAAQLSDPWDRPKNNTPQHVPPTQPQVDPFGLPIADSRPQPTDPWGAAMTQPTLPAHSETFQSHSSPWGTTDQSSTELTWPNDETAEPLYSQVVKKPANEVLDPFAGLSNSSTSAMLQPSPVASSSNDLLKNFDSLNVYNSGETMERSPASKPKQPADAFLGNAADLVNLDTLIPPTKPPSNPFLMTSKPEPPLYQFPQPPPQPSMNQLRATSMFPTATASSPALMQQPQSMNTAMFGMQPASGVHYPSYPAPNPAMSFPMMQPPMGNPGMNGNLLAPGSSMMHQQPAGVGIKSQQDSNPFLL